MAFRLSSNQFHSQQWDVAPLLQVNTEEYNCIGFARTRGRRCQKQVAAWKRYDAGQYLQLPVDSRTGSEKEHTTQIHDQLSRASELLCCWMHADQAPGIYTAWRSTIAMEMTKRSLARAKAQAEILSLQRLTAQIRMRIDQVPAKVEVKDEPLYDSGYSDDEEDEEEEEDDSDDDEEEEEQKPLLSCVQPLPETKQDVLPKVTVTVKEAETKPVVVHPPVSKAVVSMSESATQTEPEPVVKDEQKEETQDTLLEIKNEITELRAELSALKQETQNQQPTPPSPAPVVVLPKPDPKIELVYTEMQDMKEKMANFTRMATQIEEMASLLTQLVEESEARKGQATSAATTTEAETPLGAQSQNPPSSRRYGTADDDDDSEDENTARKAGCLPRAKEYLRNLRNASVSSRFLSRS